LSIAKTVKDAYEFVKPRV